jgi:hypothetical protein
MRRLLANECRTPAECSELAGGGRENESAG